MCTGTHPYIPAPNTVLLQLFYEQFGQRMENTLHYYKGGGWAPADLTDLADAAIAHWISDLKPVTSNTVSFLGVKVTDLTTETSGTYETQPSTPQVGSLTGTAMPAGTTFAIKEQTAQRGRSAHGRVYHVGLVINQVSGNQLVATSADAIKDGWAALVFGIAVDVSAAPVVVSYCHLNVWRTTAVNYFVLVLRYTDLDIDSQRRRLTGRGQ